MDRIDDFKGTQEEYIRFLEGLVRKQRKDTPRKRKRPAAPKLPQTQFVAFQGVHPGTVSEEWRTILKPFLDRVPKKEDDWAATRESVQLSRIEDLAQAFLVLTRNSLLTLLQPSSLKPGSIASIVQVLDDYASLPKQLHVAKAYTTQISRFADILFISLNFIARKVGVKPEIVDNHIKAYLYGVNSENRQDHDLGYVRHLRAAILWPIKRMAELDEKGLGHRAYELFVIYTPKSIVSTIPSHIILGGPSIHTYRRYSSKGETSKFTDAVPICKPPDGELQASITFHVPFLCKLILGQRCR